MEEAFGGTRCREERPYAWEERACQGEGAARIAAVEGQSEVMKSEDMPSSHEDRQQ